MPRAEDHLAALLRLPAYARARAAHELLRSLDAEGDAGRMDDADAEAARVAELVRRARLVESGEVELIDGDEARSRVLERLRALRQ